MEKKKSPILLFAQGHQDFHGKLVMPHLGDKALATPDSLDALYRIAGRCPYAIIVVRTAVFECDRTPAKALQALCQSHKQGAVVVFTNYKEEEIREIYGFGFDYVSAVAATVNPAWYAHQLKGIAMRLRTELMDTQEFLKLMRI